MEWIIGIDIGGTNFRLGCVARNGDLTFFEKRSSAPFKEDGAAKMLGAEIRDYMERHSLTGKVAAVAVGVPSVVSKDKSFVYSTPNLKGLEHMDLGHILEECLGMQVFVDRDVNYLLRHDIQKYGLDPHRDKTILGMYLGTGFGNPIYINGQFHAGKNGVAGELGHIPLFGLEEICPCGNEGCAELRCSGAYLKKLQTQYYPDTEIGDIFLKHGKDERILKYVRDLAYPISTEVTLLDPDYVVMGGGVMIMKDFPADYLKEQVKKRTRHPFPSENLEFIFPEYSQTSGVVGGGLSAFDAIERG